MRNGTLEESVTKTTNQLRLNVGLVSSLSVFLVALLVRLMAMYHLSPHETPQHFEMDRIAISISQGKGFSNPFPTATGPSAHYTPAYPLMLSLIYSALGTGTEAELAKLVLSAMGTSVWLAMLPFVSKIAGAGFLPGLIAGLLGAAVPLHLWTDLRGKDAPWTAVVMVAMAIGALKQWKRGELHTPLKRIVAYGVLGGAGVMLNASITSAVIAWMSATILLFRKTAGKALLYALVYLAGISLAMVPWIVRNYLFFGAFVPLRSNFGLELWISNNPLASPTFHDNDESRIFEKLHPLQNKDEAYLMYQLGEVEYSKRKLDLAFQWILGNPGRFLRLTLQRLFFFWFPPPYRQVQAIILWALSILAIYGLWRSRHDQPHLFRLIVYLWTLYPIVFYFVQIDMRYRYPMYWSILLMAAYGVLGIASSVFRKSSFLALGRMRFT